MNSLKPPMQPRPSNIWMFALNSLCAFGLILVCWMIALQVHRTGIPIGAAESAFTGTHPVLHAMADVFADGGASYKALRWINTVSVLLTITVLMRMLWPLCGGGLASLGLILFLCLPNMVYTLLTSGGLACSTLCFVSALSLLTQDRPPLVSVLAGLLGGMAVALCVWWLLPLGGMLAGSFLTDRKKIVHHSVGAAIGISLMAMFSLLNEEGFTLFAGLPWVRIIPSVGTLTTELYVRNFTLVVGVALFLWRGVGRSGVWWWTLAGATLSGVFAVFFSRDVPGAIVPFLILACISMPRLTQLLDLRFPVVYQSVLAVQLLLWLPIVAGWESSALLPGLPVKEEVHQRKEIVELLNVTPGGVLTTLPVGAMLGDHLIEGGNYHIRRLDENWGKKEDLARRLGNQEARMVLLHRRDLENPVVSKAVEEGYQTLRATRDWRLFAPKVR